VSLSAFTELINSITLTIIAVDDFFERIRASWSLGALQTADMTDALLVRRTAYLCTFEVL
jgi:hypothetical protein